jgi:hypothetical protein
MERREFIILLGGAAAVWPVITRAQQAAMPIVSYLGPGSAESDAASRSPIPRASPTHTQCAGTDLRSLS